MLVWITPPSCTRAHLNPRPSGRQPGWDFERSNLKDGFRRDILYCNSHPGNSRGIHIPIMITWWFIRKLVAYTAISKTLAPYTQNRPISLSHDAPAPYPTIHHIETEMCIFLFPNGAMWDRGQVHFGVCVIGLYITMTSKWARWRIKSPASRLFTQPFIREEIKANIKAPRHWPLCGEFTGDRWIHRTNGQ